MDSQTLERLTISTLSLHSMIQASHALPAAPRPSPLSVLLSLRASVAALQRSLAETHTLVLAQRKGEAIDPSATVEELEVRVQRVREQVAQAREKEARRQRLGEGLNGALVVQEVLQSSEGEKWRSKELLLKKDDMALELMGVRKDNERMGKEKAIIRKRMLALTRKNTKLTKELRETEEVTGVIISQASDALQKRYNRHLLEELSLLSRHTIIRTVLQLIVVESGVPWYTTEREKGGDGMTTAKLLRLMREAGDGKEWKWEENDEAASEAEEQAEETQLAKRRRLGSK
ncbi:hypothetical protein P7C70_g2472, partial [Phenoliferia sp. Uapishka_3]